MSYAFIIKASRNAAERACYRKMTGANFEFGSARSSAKQMLAAAIDLLDHQEVDGNGNMKRPREVLRAIEDAQLAVDIYAAMPQAATYGA